MFKYNGNATSTTKDLKGGYTINNLQYCMYNGMKKTVLKSSY